MDNMASVISELSQKDQSSWNSSGNSQVSDVTMGTMFGGKNNQKTLKSRNTPGCYYHANR